jgi:hypothetical protein
MNERPFTELLGKLSPERRERVEKFVANSAFVEPVVASFPLDGNLTVSKSMASAGNSYNPWPMQADSFGNG